MAGFKFPQTIVYDGRVWHLQYAPDNPITVRPDMQGSQVVSATCDPVRVPGREQPLYVAILDIVFPARQDIYGNVMSERRLKGFRTYITPPPQLNPQTVPVEDCAFYVAEPSNEQTTSAAQRFFDAIMGQAQAEERKAKQADGAWCQELSQLQTALPEVKDGPQHTDGTSDQ